MSGTRAPTRRARRSSPGPQGRARARRAASRAERRARPRARVHEAPRGIAGLPFPLTGPSGSASTIVADERGRCRPQQNLAGRAVCSSLWHDDSVTGDRSARSADSRPRPRVLTPVGSRARDPSRRREVAVELGDRLAHLEGSPNSTERVVLVQDGNAEHRHDRIADELLDGPPCRSRTTRIASKTAPITRRCDSGSRRSPSRVESRRRRRHGHGLAQLTRRARLGRQLRPANRAEAPVS